MASSQHLPLWKRIQWYVIQVFGARINLVLCGRRESGKTSLAKFILGRAELPAASSPGECVKHQGEVCGRWVSLVELPALSGKPLKTVMEQCLRCISLCAPEGVHAFILVLPGHPTSKDKEEFETLQNTLSTQVRDFTVVLFSMKSDDVVAVNFSRKRGMDLQKLCKSCEGGDLTFNPTDQQQVSKLLDYLHTFKTTKNEPYSYTMEILVQAQIEKISVLQRLAAASCNQQSPDSLRIAIIGKTGSGKSSSGNTILGRNVFETRQSQKSVTKVCQKAEAEVEGRRVYVVDTPGLFDTAMSVDEVNNEILKCISLLAPGPHVFLLVLQIGRFTPEENKTLKLIQEGFGKHAEKYTVTLFTHGDKLVSEGILIEDYIENQCDEFVKKFISEYGNKYHVFNNSDTSEQTQVKELMKMINDTIKENEGSCYSTQMLVETEMDIKKNMKRQLEEMKRQIKELEEDVGYLEDEIREKDDKVLSLQQEVEELKTWRKNVKRTGQIVSKK